MLILTSPAKRLDFESKIPENLPLTIPKFVEEANEIAKRLSKFSVKQLENRLEVSKALAELNHQRFGSWQNSHSKTNSRQAIWAYQGDVYHKINQNEFSKQKTDYAQNSLRIITGMYGVLRPYDLIQPYRLEMKVKYKVDGKKRPYVYWEPILTDYFQKEIKKNNHKLIVNCASAEYVKPIDFKQLDIPIYTIKFKQLKDGKEKSSMLPIKHARGFMINYLIRNEVKDLDGVKKFKEEGYKLTEETQTSLTFLKVK